MQNTGFKRLVGKRVELAIRLTGDRFRKHNNLILEKKRAQARRIEMHRKKNEEKSASRMQVSMK